MSTLGEVLLSSVLSEFNRLHAKDREIERLRKRLWNNTAAYEEADLYADRMGNLLADAWHTVVTPEELPDGYMSAELARELLYPAGRHAYTPVADFTKRVQEYIYEKGGVNLKAQIPAYDTERVDGIATMIGKAERYEEHAKEVEQSIVNVTQAVVDTAVRLNAEFIRSAGGRAIITRVGDANPCPWCSDLVGSYEYGSGKEPDDLYRRHRDCHCIVALELPGGRWQDAHSKIDYKSMRDVYTAREKEILNARR